MSALGKLERGNDLKSRIFYRLLSLASGQDLAETEKQRLRKHRKQTLEKYRNVGLGTPELHSGEAMDAIIDMGLKESKLMDDFEPDLLIVTELQYKELFDIPAGIGIEHDTYTDLMDHSYDVGPPMVYHTDAGTIQVTYSDKAEGMLLVDSSSL